MIDRLVEQLHSGENSLVICNGEVRAFDERGISALYGLLKNEVTFLKGSSVADKIVGRAAASLMVLGGVKELYAEIISDSALELLETASIIVSYGLKVQYIINRTNTGMCPMEICCKDCTTAEECLEEIEKFRNAHQKGNPHVNCGERK